MGRNIKHYNGSYIAATGNNMNTQSTGYTVPSGKVARIGFNLSSVSGNSSGYGQITTAGFFAGTNGAGSTSTGHSTNRFLMIYHPSTNGGTDTEIYMSVNYNPLQGHIWSSKGRTDYAPKLFLGSSSREKYTTRNNQYWPEYNFIGYNSNSTTENWGTLRPTYQNSTTVSSQHHDFAPHISMSNYDQYNVGANAVAPPVHAFAGETVYIYDWSWGAVNDWANRAFKKMQWSMFIIEEDA